MVRALLFDVFGTVVDWRGSLIEQFSGWGAARGLVVDWPGFVDAWRGAYAPSMDRVRRGEVAWTNLDGLHLESLRVLAPRFGLVGADGAALDAAALEWVNRGWHRLRPWGDSVDGLRRLKAGFVISPLSNGNVALLVGMAKRAGLPWDLVLGAEVFRHYKPDPETYLGAAALLGLEPGEVMMCAAHNGDLVAARACGLRTAFILRGAEHGPGQRTDLGAAADWDYSVGGIGELADALGCAPSA